MKKVIDKENQLMKKVDWQDDSICYVAILSETVQKIIYSRWKVEKYLCTVKCYVRKLENKMLVGKVPQCVQIAKDTLEKYKNIPSCAVLCLELEDTVELRCN